MKAIWYYMSGIFAHGSDVFKMIKVCKTHEEYMMVINEIFYKDYADDNQLADYFNYSLKHIGDSSE